MKIKDTNNNAEIRQSDIQLVTHSNLILGAKVVNGEQNTGVISSIDDKHNVEVLFDNGGVGVWCFVENCEQYIKDSEDPLYYCK